MKTRLSPSTLFFLLMPPLLWAGNAVIGRMVSTLVPPITLNFIRWFLALLILIPLGRSAFASGNGLLVNWRRYAMLGLLGVGLYNALQYLALHTSTPVNVTLVGASMPIWVLVLGAAFFGNRVSIRQWAGAALSILGVLLVLSHGDWRQLMNFRFVPGDLYMLVATVIWAFYSWLLTDTSDAPGLRANWAAFLLAQVLYGTLWSGLFAGMEWALTDWIIHWSWPLAGALAFVTIGPAIIAFRCWGAGVQRAGPGLAAIFYNLTPLFAAVLSIMLLGDTPRWHHGLAFALILGGIVVSVRTGK
ncbi:MAG: DMT family transporter [Castellaniella sp.]